MTLITSNKTCIMHQILFSPLFRYGRNRTHVGCSHSGQLGVRIVRRRNFDNIGRDDVKTVEAAQDRAQFTRRPA